MQYMLLFVDDHADVVHDMSAWEAYMGAMAEGGILRSGEELSGNDTATTVRIRGGKREVQDGPFADIKEQLGGFVVIEVDDLDTAIEWAARSPAAELGKVEVRPVIVHEMPETA
ncbi:MAG: YciI family protein [Pseudomonadota bacterium]